MYSATEARQRTRTRKEAEELVEIFAEIDAACSHKARFTYHKIFSSDLIWDIIVKDFGYKVKYGGEKGIIITW